ncbi:MAG: hypothetical protein J6N21_19810 [Butyrivibrio sp.]|nr:hypothetical protein [Butyrivibrio sp.]
MGSIVTYHLKQETPMWHFQYREKAQQNGATLRGSDVKPRFDKFLINQMKAEGINWEDFKISADHDALNYKIRIVAKGNPVTNNNMGENAFFANMGKNIDKELAVFYKEGIDVKITCFIPALMTQIDKHIQAFFIIHNFGTRQDKGFGSFTVENTDNPCDVESVLLNYSHLEHYIAYKIDASKCTDSKVLDNAYVLYQWMKSGINFGSTYKKSLLTQYMLGKNIGGEKRWMKEKGIAPKVRKASKKEIVDDDRVPEGKITDYRYIRAVMGVSGIQSWVTSTLKRDKDGNRCTDKKGNPIYKKVEIAVSSKEIERFQSPITIKVIDNKVYFLAYDLNTASRKSLLGKEFTFSNDAFKKNGPINVIENFDMEDFMEHCEKIVNKDSFTMYRNQNQYEYLYTMNKITAGGNN